MQWNPSNHPISELRDWNNAKKLEIRPDFQRKEVWSKAAKLMLIDTIIKNIPMPKIYLETKVDDESTYRIVIDGQQRITAILEYLDGTIILPSNYEDQKWAGKPFKELEATEKSQFLNYLLDINNLVNPTEQEVRDLYSRVNKYTVQLNKQELRKCDYPGNYIDLAEKMVQLPFFDNARVFTASMTRRMNDVEYVEELLAVILEGMQDKKKSLDELCEKYEVITNLELTEEAFKQTINNIETIFTGIDITKTRFKQRTDLYTIFAVVYQMISSGKKLKRDLHEVRRKLIYLDENIKKITDKIGIVYKAFLTTNGSMLSKELLQKVKFSSIQLTFDGLEKTHDRLRVSDHFHFKEEIELIENIMNFSQAKVLLRTNICKENKDEIIALHKYIFEKFGNERIEINPNRTIKYHQDDSFEMLSVQEYAEVAYQIKLLWSEQKGKFELPVPRSTPCKFPYGNALVQKVTVLFAVALWIKRKNIFLMSILKIKKCFLFAKNAKNAIYYHYVWVGA